jgi:hypothetical protein
MEANSSLLVRGIGRAIAPQLFGVRLESTWAKL